MTKSESGRLGVAKREAAKKRRRDYARHRAAWEKGQRTRKEKQS